jgi:putative transposase
MVAFIDDHREVYGVEPICAELPIAPQTYYAYKRRAPSDRALRDTYLREQIQRVYDDNFKVYGARKLWLELNREGIRVARCTVERLMHAMGLQGVRRGLRRARTTNPDRQAAQTLPDLVEREFTAARPDQVWCADMTYVSLAGDGFCYTALITDVYSRRVVGWAVGTSLAADLPLAALEQALHRRGGTLDGLIHHSDRGCQYTSVRYADRLDLERITASMGAVGDSYDNALVESAIGLYKTELIDRHGPWPTALDVELATLEYINWFNHTRIHTAIGDRPPAEHEAAYWNAQNDLNHTPAIQ